MQQLEDCKEAIKHIKKNSDALLSEIQKLDMIVQNEMNKKAKEEQVFFRNARKMSIDRRETKFQSMMADYQKILEAADEKISIIEIIREMVSDSAKQVNREIEQARSSLQAESPEVVRATEKKVAKIDAKLRAADAAAVAAAIVDKTRKVSQPRRKRFTKKAPKKKEKSSRSSSTSSNDENLKKRSARRMGNFLVQTTENELIKIALASIAVNVPNVEDAAAVAGPSTSIDSKIYCICGQISYGDMIACDNNACPHEWFHYGCVNLTAAPNGRWYCSQCSQFYF